MVSLGSGAVAQADRINNKANEILFMLNIIMDASDKSKQAQMTQSATLVITKQFRMLKAGLQVENF